MLPTFKECFTMRQFVLPLLGKLCDTNSTFISMGKKEIRAIVQS